MSLLVLAWERIKESWIGGSMLKSGCPEVFGIKAIRSSGEEMRNSRDTVLQRCTISCDPPLILTEILQDYMAGIINVPEYRFC